MLVPGGFILTATYCINWCGTGMMALGEVYPAEPAAPTALTCRTSMAELHALCPPREFWPTGFLPMARSWLAPIPMAGWRCFRQTAEQPVWYRDWTPACASCSEDGRSLYVSDGVLPTSIYKVDLSTTPLGTKDRSGQVGTSKIISHCKACLNAALSTQCAPWTVLGERARCERARSVICWNTS